MVQVQSNRVAPLPDQLTSTTGGPGWAEVCRKRETTATEGWARPEAAVNSASQPRPVWGSSQAGLGAQRKQDHGEEDEARAGDALCR